MSTFRRGVASAAEAPGAVAASVAVAASTTLTAPTAYVRGVGWGMEDLPVGVGTVPAKRTGARHPRHRGLRPGGAHVMIT
ncbi:hypothetical protein GCM10012286_35650 [Streptomyces lasiicapitis]|uniref:Uncharacterized protein n=1 Tax=Streptomyces lasiicapitis TaxID=1923961 RepID=A0ABQ2M2F4_9ACTN|nr:hypothetical protein GCM10012286_35650 [Streptomyces lasiicapitis]